MRTSIRCDLFQGYTVDEITTARKAIDLLNEAINSEKFHNMVIYSQFSGTSDSPLIILDRLLSGADRYDPRVDYVINLRLVMYSRWWSRVVGYVIDGDRTIYTNRKFFPRNEWNAVYFASNLLHEYTHLVGYSHRNAKDHTSVPYMMNSIFENWALQKGFQN